MLPLIAARIAGKMAVRAVGAVKKIDKIRHSDKEKIDKKNNINFPHSDEEKKMNESFTDQHLKQLENLYGKISGINPDSEHYEKLIKHLESMPKEHLEQLAAADIKFVSPLARNTLRNMKTENYGRKLQTDSVHYPSRLNEQHDDENMRKAKEYEELAEKHFDRNPELSNHYEKLAKKYYKLAGIETENDGRKLQTDSVHYLSRLNEYVNAISKNHKFTDIKYMIENEQADDDPHHERFKKEADSYSAEEHEMAKRLHEDWRAGLSDREKDDPRERSKMGGPKRPINVDYDKLHPSAKLENLAAARAAIQAVRLHGDNKEAAAEHIHNEWMKRKDLHVPYNEWSEEEKEKDREHHRIASEILARRASVLNK